MSDKLTRLFVSSECSRPRFSSLECSHLSMTWRFSRRLSYRFPLIWWTASSALKGRPRYCSTIWRWRGICIPLTRTLRYLERIFSSGTNGFGPLRLAEFLHSLQAAFNPSFCPACLGNADSSRICLHLEQRFMSLLKTRPAVVLHLSRVRHNAAGRNEHYTLWLTPSTRRL